MAKLSARRGGKQSAPPSRKPATHQNVTHRGTVTVRERDTLRQALVKFRFSERRTGKNQLAALLRAVDRARDAEQPIPQFVVVHDPYTAQDDEDGRGSSSHSSESLSREALLDVFAATVRDYKDCEVVSFLDVRLTVDPSTPFFEHILIPKFQELQLARANPFFARVGLALGRVGVVLRALAGMFGLIFTGLVALVGAALRLIVDPTSRPANAGLDPLTIALLAIGILLLLGGGAWLALRDHPDVRAQWRAQEPIQRKRDQATRITSNTAELFNLVPLNKTLVLIVNDLDFLDARSFTALRDLYDAAKVNQPWKRACIVVGYNPRSPGLAHESRSLIRNQLKLIDPGNEPDDKFWTDSINVPPLVAREVESLLWNHLGDETSKILLGAIDNDANARLSPPEHLLVFFDYVDCMLRLEGRALADITGPELLKRYRDFEQREEREIQELESAIDVADNTGQSLEALKVILAFYTAARVESVNAIVQSIQADFANPRIHTDVLTKPPIAILSTRDGAFRFNDLRLRNALRAGWKRWRDQRHDYANRVFQYEAAKLRWDPEQALMSAPCREVVETLYVQGLFHYQYYGQSDVGTALRFLGRDNGATQKWFELCEAVHRDPSQNPYDVLLWKPLTRLDPYKFLRSKKQRPQHPVFGPELLLTAADAYWMAGQPARALALLDEWDKVQDWLPVDPPDEWPSEWRDECSQRLRLARAGMKLLAAKIRHHLGMQDDWSTSIKLSRPYREAVRPASAEQQTRADLHATLIEHHRIYSTGMLWSPFKFRSNETADRLLTIGRSSDAADTWRLRALHAVCLPLWEQPPTSAVLARVDVLERTAWATEAALTHLRSIHRRPGVDPIDVPPGGRAGETELLMWEGVFLVARGLHLRAWAGAEDDPPTADDVLAKLKEFASHSVWSPGGAEKVSTVIRQANARLRDSAADRCRPIVQQLVTDVLSQCAIEADDRFGHSDALYRRLDHRPGRAEVAFFRSLTRYATGTPEGDPDVAGYAAQRLDLSDGLGFHADHLWAYLVMFIKAREFDVPARVRALQGALGWFTEPGPGLPRIVGGRLAYVLGDLLTEFRGDRELRWNLFKRAQSEYERYLADARDDNMVLDQLREDLVWTRWYLASLVEPTPPKTAEDAVRLAEAEEHLNWILGIAPEWCPTRPDIPPTAHFLKGKVCLARRDRQTALSEMLKALAYFEEPDSYSEFWQMQILTLVLDQFVQTAASEDAGETPVLTDVPERYEQLTRVAHAFVERRKRGDPTLTTGDVAQLSYASRLLGHYYWSRGDLEHAFQWLVEAFDARTALGMFGWAIASADEIGPLTNQLGDTPEVRAFRRRLAEAPQHMHPGEPVDRLEIAGVLRRYFVHGVPGSATMTRKREALQTYRMLREVDAKGAAAALDVALELIDITHPEEVDLELLERVIDVRAHEREFEKVQEFELQREQLRDALMTRDFLALAKWYQERGQSPLWALRIATDVRWKSGRDYDEARNWLEDLRK